MQAAENPPDWIPMVPDVSTLRSKDGAKAHTQEPPVDFGDFANGLPPVDVDLENLFK